MSWLKNVGDKVEAGDPVMVVESDKADMEVESFDEGYVASILVDEGSEADVGAVVALKDNDMVVLNTDTTDEAYTCAWPSLLRDRPMWWKLTTAPQNPIVTIAAAATNRMRRLFVSS